MQRPASKYDALYKKYSFLSEVVMFECGEGWFEILSELCAKLDALQLGPNFKADQIKEKFGGLRFYINGLTVPKRKKGGVHKLIAEAENKSAKTCEWCGKLGRKVEFNGGCYIVTLCIQCKKETNK